MTYEEALNQNINLSPIQAKNDLERYLLREEKPIPKAVAMGMKALEKQITKKPMLLADGYWNGEIIYDTWTCPNCGKSYETDFGDDNYCHNCGQALDWSDT